MILRPFLIDDLEAVCEMFMELTNITYSKHKKGQSKTFLEVIKHWIITKKDIFIIEHEGKIIGFSLSYVEDWEIIEPFYRGELIYVKEDFRNSKAGFLLYANVLNMAKNLNIPIHAKGFIHNNASKILSKFGEPYFIEYIKV